MSTERIISADSHVNPPKDLWTRNAPAKLKDRVPRVESTDMGDFWIVDSQVSGAIGLDSSAGRKPEDFKAFGLGYKDMRPGSYDPKARLEDMDTRRRRRRGPLLRRSRHAVPEGPRAAALHRPALQRLDGGAVEGGAEPPRRPRAHPARRPRRGDRRSSSASPRWVCKGFHCDPFPDERGGKPLWDPAYEPFWSLIEETGLPLSFHIVGPRNANVHGDVPEPHARRQGDLHRHRAHLDLRDGLDADLHRHPRAPPEAQVRARRVRHRLDPLLPRAHGPDVQQAPLLDQVDHHREAEHLLVPPGPRDLHPGPGRRRGAPSQRAEATSCGPPTIRTPTARGRSRARC